MRARRLLEEHATLAARRDGDQWTPEGLRQMSEIDRELGDIGRGILARMAERLFELTVGFYPADLDVPASRVALWRRWVGLEDALPEAERQCARASAGRDGACTSPSDLLALLHVSDEVERTREALRKSGG